MANNKTIDLSNLPQPENNKHRSDLLKAYKSTTLSMDQAADLRQQYRDTIPFVQLSRCPITKQIMSHSVDIYGIDGLWWDDRNPVRPQEKPNKTLLAFTGAMLIDKNIEFTNFLVKPGPAVPFVIPRMLSCDSVQAVISCLRVGQHLGFVIAYFADPFPIDTQRANDWGQETYQLIGSDGQLGWNSSDDIVDDYDFDIAPWIKQGKLHCIAPADTKLELNTSLKNCPYIDLKGLREIQRIQEGTLWYPSLVDKQDAINKKQNEKNNP